GGRLSMEENSRRCAGDMAVIAGSSSEEEKSRALQDKRTRHQAERPAQSAMVHVKGALAFWRRSSGEEPRDLPVSEKSQQRTSRCGEDAQRLENPFEHRLALLSGMSCPSTMDRS
ncbi:MAG TPA: hypothetical protein VL199_08600, partial [Burkholderiales bacterium]|nr:hypothetical protein [Burkholderiales bacterium]